ncbi:MAG: Holliday junction resolvase RuvX [Aquihabitans sp.]
MLPSTWPATRPGSLDLVRVMALDLGSRRIGVAISDNDGRVATPVTVVERHKDRPRLHRELAELVAEWEAELVLLGLPVDLEGKLGPAAQNVLAERDELAAALPVPVEVHDERMTTKIADRALRERGDLDGRARRQVIDMVAAAVILQDWLDQRLGGAATDDESDAIEGDPEQ